MHVLRSGDDTPAFLSFRFACLGCLDYKGRRGRPRSNLFNLLFKDIMTNHSAGKRDRDPNPPPVACSKVAEGGREL